jgi:MraZ protein
MFRSSQPTRVDEKGRLKLPVEFKRVVDGKYNAEFFITSQDGVTAQIYPMAEWEKIEAKLALIPDMNPAKKKYVDRVNYYGQVAEMDAQGRMLLPQILRETARLSGDVLVVGKQTFLAVENLEVLKKRIESEPMTTDDHQALASFGI